MSQNVETTIVDIKENYRKCTGDSLKVPVSERKPAGYVEIYEKTGDDVNNLIGKSNLVVYQGREWIASRIFNKTNLVPQIPQGASGYNHFIYWFGLGNGGVPAGDPFNPIVPVSTDTNLISPVSFGTSNSAGVLGGLSGSKYYKMKFEGIDFIPDADNDSKYLIARITINVDVQYAEGEILSEAGLFTSPPSGVNPTVGDANGPFHLFSRVTFPAISKTGSRQLVFVWYIYV